MKQDIKKKQFTIIFLLVIGSLFLITIPKNTFANNVKILSLVELTELYFGTEFHFLFPMVLCRQLSPNNRVLGMGALRSCCRQGVLHGGQSCCQYVLANFAQECPMLSPCMSFNSSRRVFMMQVATAASAVMVMGEASAQAMVDEKDPQAAGLSYKADATKVDKAKNPKFVAGSNCANCALYQAKAGAAAGACPLFAGKQVGAKAWCSAWAKKA